MNEINLYWIDNIYKSINFKNLSHGIIINGPEGIGKEILAKKISSKLLNNKHDESIELINNHPDFLIINKEKILLKHITYRDNEWDEDLGKRNVNDFLSRNHQFLMISGS